MSNSLLGMGRVKSARCDEWDFWLLGLAFYASSQPPAIVDAIYLAERSLSMATNAIWWIFTLCSARCAGGALEVTFLYLNLNGKIIDFDVNMKWKLELFTRNIQQPQQHASLALEDEKNIVLRKYIEKIVAFFALLRCARESDCKKKQSLMIQDSNSRGLVRLSIQLFIFLHSFLNAVWVKRREMNDGRLRWNEKKWKKVS